MEGSTTYFHLRHVKVDLTHRNTFFKLRFSMTRYKTLVHNDRRSNTCAPWSFPCFASRASAFLTPTVRIDGRKSHPTITHTPATMQVKLDNWHNTKRFTTPCVKELAFTNIENPTSKFSFWVPKKKIPNPRQAETKGAAISTNTSGFLFYKGVFLDLCNRALPARFPPPSHLCPSWRTPTIHVKISWLPSARNQIWLDRRSSASSCLTSWMTAPFLRRCRDMTITTWFKQVHHVATVNLARDGIVVPIDRPGTVNWL